MKSPDKHQLLAVALLLMLPFAAAETVETPNDSQTTPLAPDGTAVENTPPPMSVNNRAPINVSADRATYENGRGIYEGRVELKQGNLAINAKRLVIDEQNRQVDRILATGKPAELNQSNGSVHAEAHSIEYFVGSGRVILTDKAIIQQQGSEIRGNRIVYDSRQQTVEAEGDSGAEKGRVNMTLQPRGKDDTEEEPATQPQDTDR